MNTEKKKAGGPSAVFEELQLPVAALEGGVYGFGEGILDDDAVVDDWEDWQHAVAHRMLARLPGDIEDVVEGGCELVEPRLRAGAAEG